MFPLRLFLGYLLLALTFVASVALFSRTYGGAHGNWMGPYFGEALARDLSMGLGRLPTILFLITLGTTGLRFLVREKFQGLGRIAFGSAALFLLSEILLTLRIADLQNLSALHLERNGGLLGVFLVRQLVEPVFGPSRVGPAIFCGLGVLLTLGLAFKLRPAHFAPVWIALSRLWSWIRSKVGNVHPLESRNADDPLITRIHRNEDTSDFPVLCRGQVKPFEADKASPLLSTEFRAPPPSLQTAVSHSPKRDIEASQGQNMQAIQRIEQTLRHAREMDPREVRRLRDELADLRRVSEMNNWEDRKAGELRIEGIVKPQSSTVPHAAPLKKPVVLPEEETKVAPVVPVEIPSALESASHTKSHEAVPSKVASAPHFPGKDGGHKADLFSEHSGEYLVPKVGNVLDDVPEQPIDYSQEELKQLGSMLEQQLENFRIKGKVVHIATGPVITRLEVEPGPGVKVSRFAGLSDDLALALKANSIRVLAPIPGKSVVGIEIPNRKAQTVFCREILESPRFMPDPYTLQIVLGKDITGNAFVMDLARAPHLLIAGQTGSGKSVCINALMASLLFSKSPDDLRMILVDPKVVELKSYEKIPHLLHPVVTDPGTAVQALQWACAEMDRRYGLLAQAGVRNIAGFNQKLAKGELDDHTGIAENDRKRMPFIVIVVDEFADVIMQAKKEFEDPVIRLAQKARAAGMHMVLATQRPSTNVITGIIKANLPTRISFKVASHIDARTVLDHAGAEKLLGRGDMLFRSIDDPEPVRVHGAFLSDDDAERVASACSSQEVDYPQLSSFAVVGSDATGKSNDPMDAPDQDELFWDAAELCVLQGGGSTSLLQRRFSIGYARAGRLMDQLFRAGIVGPERGSKPRECLMSADEIAQLRRTRGV